MKTLLATLCLLCISMTSLAHHTGSSNARGSYYQITQTKPSSRAYFSYSLSLVDESIAEIHSWTIGGEWAVTKQISLISEIPITVIDHHFQSNDEGIGDIAIGSKFLFLERDTYFSFITTALQLPTGNETSGIGSGNTIQNIELFGGVNLKEWTLFLSPGISFGYDSPSEPLILIALGATSPKFKEQFYFSFGARTQVFVTSSDLSSGSWKLFLEPQLYWDMDKEAYWTLSLGGKICIIDQLSSKRSLTTTDNALLSDIVGGATLTLNHRF